MASISPACCGGSRVLVFALIQLVLVARILLDLGVIPVDSGFGEMVVTLE